MVQVADLDLLQRSAADNYDRATDEVVQVAPVEPKERGSR